MTSDESTPALVPLLLAGLYDSEHVVGVFTDPLEARRFEEAMRGAENPEESRLTRGSHRVLWVRQVKGLDVQPFAPWVVRQVISTTSRLLPFS